MQVKVVVGSDSRGPANELNPRSRRGQRQTRSRVVVFTAPPGAGHRRLPSPPPIESVLAMSAAPDKCPVDHRAFAASPSSSASSPSAETCPVDHAQRSTWTSVLGRHSEDYGAAENPDTPLPPVNLPADRETSSIPRLDGTNWVYPSQAQFYAAMARKNHNPQETDMKVVVPIHNAVNERAWSEIMKWETSQGGDKCGGVKLVSFKARPNYLSPRARWYSLLGCVRAAFVCHAPLTQSFRDADFRRHLTATIGSSTDAGRACAMSSTFTPGILTAPRPKTSRSSSTSDRHWTTGKVCGCA